eukprot:Trichotokara_eunicae@DN2556_c0_g1_i1.p1
MSESGSDPSTDQQPDEPVATAAGGRSEAELLIAGLDGESPLSRLQRRVQLPPLKPLDEEAFQLWVEAAEEKALAHGDDVDRMVGLIPLVGDVLTRQEY